MSLWKSSLIGEKQFSYVHFQVTFILREKERWNSFILTQRIVISLWTYSKVYFSKQTTTKSCHFAVSIPFSLNKILLLKKISFSTTPNSSSFSQRTKFFFFFSLSNQRKIISLSNEILSSIFSMKRFSCGGKSSMKSWQDRQMREKIQSVVFPLHLNRYNGFMSTTFQTH